MNGLSCYRLEVCLKYGVREGKKSRTFPFNISVSCPLGSGLLKRTIEIRSVYLHLLPLLFVNLLYVVITLSQTANSLPLDNITSAGRTVKQKTKTNSCCFLSRLYICTHLIPLTENYYIKHLMYNMYLQEHVRVRRRIGLQIIISIIEQSCYIFLYI